ncbi:proprotein convertase P-domain-containing protein [Lewinella sp. JB7]|uniref:proprotein convertase P-domain-containing protein n=1 Tax=Lewinella sp. JB7 TaxID=2962887 RepID=UPI0020C94382|nr:proprotein convertase P-domain-containing protein [Lewinella sp. JB7]MCP9235309.1 proprotein convertase P-domain-containing protein [Lewinella sp. JB7]
MSQNYLRGLYLMICCVFGAPSFGQEVLITQGGTVRQCGGTFIDGGGIDGDHAFAGTRETITICSDNRDPENSHVELNFTVIDLRGTLTIHNGSNDQAPVLTEITADNNSDRIRVAATAANVSGCLTVVFTSAGRKAGWEADIGCVAACQPITARLESSSPAVQPGPGGYIDVCVGDEILLTGTGTYPENNARYPQSDSRSTFRWDFQDGTTATGRQVSKIFTEPGGYTVGLSIIDEKGCTSQNSIAQRVRVSAPPDWNPSRDVPLLICPGEAVTLGIGNEARTEVNFQPTPVTLNFTEPQPFSERIDIPEQPGTLLSSDLLLRDFPAGQLLTSGDGIVEICVTIEHSYIGDLSMWVECPDGSRVDLLQYDPRGLGATNQKFGEATEDCSTADEPFTYCWSSKGLYTVPTYARTLPPGGATIPPEITYLPLDGSFDNLAGCSLNGDWSLNVIDNQSGDCGTVYSWAITFADNLVTPSESFTVPQVSAEWSDSGIHSDYRPQRITYTGNNPGFANQRLIAQDSFGCRYDTLVPVRVRSPYSAACFSCPEPLTPPRDTSVCEGTPFRPGLSTNLPPAEETIRWEAFTDMQLPRPGQVSGGVYSSTLSVTDQRPATVTNPATDMGDVCLDLTGTNDLATVEVLLRSPGGSEVVLAPFGTLSGTRTQQCFTPDNTTAWAALRGARINGDWTLVLRDRAAGQRIHLTSWSIGFVRRSDVTYSWLPATSDLSCTDCPDPVITPSRSERYVLTARNADGCTSFATIDVNVLPFSPTFTADYQIACRGDSTGGIDLTPNQPLTGETYRWSNGAVSQDLVDVPEGIYSLTVTGANGCTETFTYELDFPPPLTLNLDLRQDIACAGDASGSIRTDTEGGSPPYRYAWSDPTIGDTGAAERLTAGTYTVTVTDRLNCTATLTTTLAEPPPLGSRTTASAVSCRGGADGTAETVATGGSEPYFYRWSNGESGARLSSLPAGEYSVTVTDDNGCTVIDSATVGQPEEALTVTLVDPVAACNGASLNGLTARATGGLPPYRFAWSSGESDSVAVRLMAGENSVAVTDAAGCTVERTFITEARPPLTPVIAVDSENACDPSRQHYLAVAGEYFTYRWSTGDTTRRIPVVDGVVSYAVTVTDGAGCTGESTYSYTPPQAVTFTVIPTSVSCFGARDGGLRIEDLRGPAGNSSDYDLVWGPGADFTVGATITDRPAGTYLLTITDSTGCRIDTNLTIPTPELLVISGQRTEVDCSGEANGAITTMVTGGTGNYTYRWEDGSQVADRRGLTAGTYAVTVTDEGNCSANARFTLRESSPITVEATTEPATCGGEASGRIDINATGGREPLSYSLDSISYANTPSLVGIGAGTYVVYVRDAVGCTGRDTLTVEERPSLLVDLGEDREIIFGDSLLLNPTVTGASGQVDYQWSASYPGTLSCVDCPAPVATPPYEISYSLSAMDELGCESTDDLQVRVRKIREVAVPTGFSPNEDGRNDRLLVHGRPGTRVLQFTVYDRWGGVIFEDGDFEVNDPDRGWDGQSRGGEPVNGGVYLYKLRVAYEDGSQETLAGQTTLIR